MFEDGDAEAWVEQLTEVAEALDEEADGSTSGPSAVGLEQAERLDPRPREVGDVDIGLYTKALEDRLQRLEEREKELVEAVRILQQTVSALSKSLASQAEISVSRPG